MNQPDSETSPATLNQQSPESVSLNRLLIAGGVVTVGLVVILLVIFTGGGNSENQNKQTGTTTDVPDDPHGETFMNTPAEEPEIEDPPGTYQPTPEFAGSPASSGSSPVAAPPTGAQYPSNYQPYGSGSPRGGAANAGPAPEEQRFQRALDSELLVLSSPPEGPGSSADGAQRTQAPAGGSPSSGEGLTMQKQVQRRVRQLRRRYGSAGQPNGSPPGASGTGAAQASSMNLPPAATPPLASESSPYGPAQPSQNVPRGIQAQDPSGPSRTFQRRVASQAQDGTYYQARVTRPRSRYEIKAGTVIPAALMTAINSELPGSVVAQVSRDVYDSASQQHLLIPKGSRLIGSYDDQIALGQSRAMVAWTRIIFPDGRSIQLPGLGSKDLSGASGVSDEVNRHYARVFGSAIALSAIGAGFQLSQPDRGGGFGYQPRSPQQVLAAELGRELSRVATEMIRRNMDIQPTIEIRKGYRFYVFFNKDLAFPAPYRDTQSAVRFQRFSTPARRQVRGRVGRFSAAGSTAVQFPSAETTAESSN